MPDQRPVLVAVRQLLASAQALLDGLLAVEGGGVDAPARRTRARTGDASASSAGDAEASAPAAAPARRRRNPAAGRAAKARWAAMSPEERADRVRKMQAARKRT